MRAIQEEKIRQAEVLMLIFVCGGVVGFLYEEIFYRIDLGMFVKRGTTFGPWIPIYGFGAVLLTIFTYRFREHPWQVFGVAAVVAAVLEYMTGYIIYQLFGVRLWDYNTEIWNWLNVGGFICLRSVLLFAFAGVFLQYMLYPALEEYASRCGEEKLRMIAGIPALLFAADILFSLFRRCLVYLPGM